VNRLLVIAIAIAFAGQRLKHPPLPRGRVRAANRLERRLADLDAILATAPDVSPRTRAKLLLVRRPVDPDADPVAVAAYARAVAMGAAAKELADKVQATGCPELMGRLLELVRLEDAKPLRRTLVVARVMCA
jgi:hypothetical protein